MSITGTADELEDLTVLTEAALILDAAEVWRTHPMWNHLAVSTHGRVRNCNTGNLVGYMSGPRGGDRADRPNRYLRVKTGGDPASAAVSVLVLETFVGPRPEGHEADHENHNSLDNRLANLRWLPAPENQARKATRWSS